MDRDKATIFLKLGDIKGEKADGPYKEQIEVLSWSWGVHNRGAFHRGTGPSAHTASVEDITVSHWLDCASPQLFTACFGHKDFSEATITMLKGGNSGDDWPYVTCKLKNVVVTQVSPQYHGGGMPTETFHLSFLEADYEYKSQNADGSPGIAQTYHYKNK